MSETTKIYLDHNATTPLAPEALEAMLPYYRTSYGNPSSVHWLGRQAKAALDEARGQLAELIGAEENEIIFTSGGTESDNLALHGILATTSRDKKHIITSRIEHHAVLHTCQFLTAAGAGVSYIQVDSEGRIDPRALEEAITSGTALISIMLANNETGVLQSVAEIGEIARSRSILLHTDAIQAVGKIPIAVKSLNVDLLSISGHKFHAPKGVGALYVRKGIRLAPLLHGGGHERSRRAGTENVAQIAALGKAAQLARQWLAADPSELYRLRDYFESEVLRRIPEVSVNGSTRQRLPNTTNLRFNGVAAESLVINLDLAGVACSTGSACSSGSIEPSHVLSAMGLDWRQAASSVRFSLSRYTTREELDRVLEILPEIVQRMRALAK